MQASSEIHQYYKRLDREYKNIFQCRVCIRTGWKKSRFYSRLRGDSPWTEAEMNAVVAIYESFKKKYNY